MLAKAFVDHKVVVYWVAAIAPGPLPSYVTGLAPASPGRPLQLGRPVCAILHITSVPFTRRYWAPAPPHPLPPPLPPRGPPPVLSVAVRPGGVSAPSAEGGG
jgi:hypothetical protein